MKVFKTKKAAVKHCMDKLKPSLVGLDNYNRFRQVKRRYEDDPESVKENAIKNLFTLFGISENCTYELDESKAKFEKKKDA